MIIIAKNKNYIKLECIDRINYLTNKIKTIEDKQRRKNIVKDINRLENTLMKIDYGLCDRYGSKSKV